MAAPDENQAAEPNLAPAAISVGVVAELWPLAMPAATSVQRAFEIWRSQTSPAGGTTLPLDKLEIPERGTASMVRVRGVLLAPQTGGYTIQVIGVDPAEFFLADGADGAPAEWRLVQRNGNPNTGAGRVKLEQGVARRFEYWTMGRGKTSVQWELANRASAHAAKNLLVAKQPIPASSMAAPAAKPGERHANGLLDSWKKQAGLNVDSGEGPNSPWGDPDGDGVPNWLEQLSGGHPLKPDAEGRDGLIRWDLWRNIPGKYVFDLTRTAGFPQHPDEVRYLRRLEIPVGNGNEYGSRLRGLIKAPATGEFTFMLAANDTAELYLGDTESWQSKKMIARAEQQGAQARWTRAADQGGKPLFPEQMAKISLKKGQRYYIEILHKQQEKEDFCTVAWIPPGAAAPEVIGAESLVSWQRDKDDPSDSGLPESWRQSAGLMADGVDPADRTAYADPDFDGISNYDEWKAGTNPLKADAAETKHMLTCETWTEMTGDQISLLTRSPRFPGQPTLSTLVDNTDFSDEGDNYGCRLRGYLTAPEDGPYVFNIAGNHSCSLYLGVSDDKFTKRLIAQTTRGTGWRDFRASPSSEAVVLTKGQRYYIEVLFKRGARQEPAGAKRDHASIAWKRPGRIQTAIDAAYFSPYKLDPSDGDDDDLLDEWESAHGLNPQDPMGNNGAWADPDGDWLDNFQEQQLGLDPNVADVHGTPGLALWECWENIKGNMAAFKANSAYPLHPSQRKWITSLEGPQGFADFHGSRLRAYLVPPSSGDYTFAIAGDDECELFLSTSDLKYYKQRIAFVTRASDFREWDNEPSQVSRSVRLQAGKRYYIEALHHQATKADHVSVAWRGPGAKDFEIINGAALAAFAGDPADSDDDDLPDTFEAAYNLDATNYDGDKDPDGDGLTNREEFILGTDPTRADTDGDGMSDKDERDYYHSNPLVKNLLETGPPVTVALTTFTQTSVPWETRADGSILAYERRGWTDYPFTVAPGEEGLYEVRITGGAEGGAVRSVENLPLSLCLNGELLGNQTLRCLLGQNTTIRQMTPWLSAATYTVRIDNHNVRADCNLRLNAVTLQRLGGTDATSSDIPDWVAQKLADENHITRIPSASRTSPVCIEGVTNSLQSMQILAAVPQGGTGGPPVSQSQQILESTNSGFYSNVPLDPSAATALTVTFENGFRQESPSILWTTTNILAEDALTIRQGDSLKLSAHAIDGSPSGTFTLSRGAEGVSPTVIATNQPSEIPVVLAFTTPGTHTLTAIWSPADGTASRSHTLIVTVKAADFGPTFDIQTYNPRTWSVPGVNGMAIETNNDIAWNEITVAGAAARSFVVDLQETGASYVVARLPETGDIIARGIIKAFDIGRAAETADSRQILTRPDGSRHFRFTITAENLPANIEIRIATYFQGAIFDDGSRNFVLHASDFNANGIAEIFIEWGDSSSQPRLCHYVRTFITN